MRQQSTRRAFSLIELLVVIGIIGLLVAILVPTVSKVRTSANVAASQQVVSTIVNAIERYHQEFRSYPGLFPDATIRSTAPLIYQGTQLTGVTVAGGAANAGGTSVTATENLTLSLIGGLRYTVTPSVQFTYDPALVGKGPINLANPNQIKQLPEFGSFKTNAVSGGVFLTDTNIPEILDGFGGDDDQMPVLYMRARVGADGIVAINGDVTGNRYQYDQYDFISYMDWTPSHGEIDGLQTLGTWTDTVPAKGGSNLLPYFRNPAKTGTSNATGTPRMKDAFILIAPGKDRIYGSADDITNFGSVIP